MDGGLRVPIQVVNRKAKGEVIFEDDGSPVFHCLNPLTDHEELCVEPLLFEAKEEGGVLHTPGMSNNDPQLTDDWNPDSMGQKFVSRVILWDEVCTVPRAVLETFLDWLYSMGVVVICCGDQGQPPSIAGESPHEWLRERVDYYEEIEEDHRAKCPELRALKKAIRLQSDRV